MTTTTAPTAAQIATTHTLFPAAHAFAAAVEALRAQAAQIAAAGCVEAIYRPAVENILAGLTDDARRAAQDVQTVAEDGDSCVAEPEGYLAGCESELRRLVGAVREIAVWASRPEIPDNAAD